jgi:catechol 2,3-dioxygenase-like lactoylglutathione lyase family enzyme
MAKLRHLAITTPDPDKTAAFYMDVFGFEKVRTVEGAWGKGHMLADGTISLAILRFDTDVAAGAEHGKDYFGLHHIGFEVEDVRETARKIKAAGGAGRSEIDEALGMGDTVTEGREFRFSGPDRVFFDVAGAPGWEYGKGT